MRDKEQSSCGWPLFDVYHYSLRTLGIWEDNHKLRPSSRTSAHGELELGRAGQRGLGAKDFRKVQLMKLEAGFLGKGSRHIPNIWRILSTLQPCSWAF